jgi:hypothetical protein
MAANLAPATRMRLAPIATKPPLTQVFSSLSCSLQILTHATKCANAPWAICTSAQTHRQLLHMCEEKQSQIRSPHVPGSRSLDSTRKVCSVLTLTQETCGYEPKRASSLSFGVSTHVWADAWSLFVCGFRHRPFAVTLPIISLSWLRSSVYSKWVLSTLVNAFECVWFRCLLGHVVIW